MFPDRVIHFRKNLGDQVKSRSPKKLKSLIRVTYVAHLKVQVLSFYMILTSSSLHVPIPFYPVWGKFGRSGKRSFTEKVKIVNSSSLCTARENTDSKVQYYPYIISVACS